MGRKKASDTQATGPEGQCQFYLAKKKRFCRFRPKLGHQYCPEHACILGIHIDKKRIPCPLNPSHNCYEDDLEKHLKKCNVTKIQQEAQKAVYYIQGINKGDKEASGTYSTETGKTQKMCVKDLTSEDLAVMIDRVNKLYKDHVECIEAAIYEHPCVREEFCTSGQEDLSQVFGDQVALKKELLQQASLVGQLEKLGFLDDGHCFVELGAGKGKLSHWIQKASKECTNNSYLLVDRSSVRYKMDSYHRQGANESKFERIKIDIEDLCLGRVPEVSSNDAVIAVGKHLCGGATDMGIRCAVNTLGIKSLSQEQSTLVSTGANERTNLKALTLCDSTTNSCQLDTTTSVLNDHRRDMSVGLSSTNATDILAADSTESSLMGDTTSKLSEKKPQHVKSSSLSCDITGDSSYTNTTRISCLESENTTVQDSSQPLISLTGVMKVDKHLNPSCENDNSSSPEKQQRKSLLRSEIEKLQEPPAKALKLMKEGQSLQQNQRLPKGIMIALCCHHRCTWDTYIGKDFMKDCRISPQNFDVLTRLSSWATCARVKAKAPKETEKKSKLSSDGNKEGKTDAELVVGVNNQESDPSETDYDIEEHDAKDLVSSKESQSLRERLSVSEREEIGRKCKRLIDTGRIQFLRSKGMVCFLREYTSEELTPENVVLIAHHPLS